jgi:hypothetical protein
VASGHEAALASCHAGAYLRSLVTDAQVCGTRNLGFAFEVDHHFFEQADAKHPPVDLDEKITGNCAHSVSPWHGADL